MTEAGRVPAAFAVERVVAANTALAAADEVGLLSRLQRHPGTAAELSEELDLDPDMTARTLDALAAVDVLVAEEGRFRVDGDIRRVLVGSRAQFATLVDVLEGGSRRSRADVPGEASELYRAIVPVLGEAFRDTADEFAPLLVEDMDHQRPRVLDVGAGAAPWSLALARRHPELTITAVDLPGVAAATRRAAIDHGVEDRFETVAGDLFGDVLDEAVRGPFDLVVIGNVCHLFAPARVQDLLGRLVGLLGPGGRIAIVDTLPPGEPDPPGVALYALGLALRTETGRLHPLHAYECWLRRLGLTDIETHRSTLLPGITLIMCARPRRAPPQPPAVHG